MREHPILFSTPMVQSILADQKTMTRRTVKGLPENASADFIQIMVSGHHGEHGHVKCPYGKRGDVLFVRENWRPRGYIADEPELYIEYKADGKQLYFYPSEELTEKIENSMLAECKKKGVEIDGDGSFLSDEFPISWKPSIHLSKELSRIWLQIKNVQVERLQDISYTDATAEGIEMIPCLAEGFDTPCRGWKNYLSNEWVVTGNGTHTPEQISFLSLWEKINGRESLELNPWVWVISFEVLSTTGRDDIPKEILLQLDGKEAKS